MAGQEGLRTGRQGSPGYEVHLYLMSSSGKTQIPQKNVYRQWPVNFISIAPGPGDAQTGD